MDTLVRFGVAVPESLLTQFDERLQEAGLPNRSEALRQMIRDYVIKDTWTHGDGLVYGTVTFTYNHHVCEAETRITDLQHDFGDVIVCSTHVHADHDHCLEVIIVRGQVSRVNELVEAMRSLKAITSLTPVITAMI